MNNFDRRLFIFLFISFIVATIIGTLTHECGHYLVAKSLGHDASIHYDYSLWTNSNSNQVVKSSDTFWITLGGPFETILTGTIGLILLFSFQKSFHNATKLSFRQWILIFISLFWLRQTANLVIWLGGYFFTGEFSHCGDEIKLSHYLQITEWTITTLTGILGIVVLAVIIFKFIPIKQRITFIASGFTGGITGYVLWLKLFGKILMP